MQTVDHGGHRNKQKTEQNSQNKFNQKSHRNLKSDGYHEKQAVTGSWKWELFVNILKIQQNS